MSGITNRNYRQLFHSVDGELDHQDDEFESPLSSPFASCETNMDFDMGCGTEAIESVNFSGTGYGGIDADIFAGNPHGYTEASPHTLLIPDPQDGVHWDATLVDLSDGAGAEIHSNSPYQYESFPSLIESELAEAAETPIRVPRCYTCPASEQEEEEEERDDANVNPCVSPKMFPDSEILMDDDTTLAASADVMSLHPPFWPISSDSDGEDDASFANNGWGAQEIRRGWVPEQCPSLTPEEWEEEERQLENLHRSSRNERTREWLRRGGVS